MKGRTWRDYRRSSFIGASSQNIGIFFGSWGEGHARPPKLLIAGLLSRLASRTPIVDLLDHLEDILPTEQLPHWLRPVSATSNTFPATSVEACAQGRKIRVRCTVDCALDNLVFAFYLLNDGERHSVRWYRSDAVACFDAPDCDGRLEVVVFIRGGLGLQWKMRVPVVAAPSTKIKRIEKVDAEVENGRIRCRIRLVDCIDEMLKFAFYIHRNEQRVHVSKYSRIPELEFDTKGLSGYYRVDGFVKDSCNSIEYAKSVPLFVNPLEVDHRSFPKADQDRVAYLVSGGSWRFPVLYYPSAEQSLFVMMPSAVNRAKVRLPAFNRWTWALKGIFPGHVLCVSDPTLDRDEQLGLGWCIGDMSHCATEEISKFVVEFAAFKGIPNHRIVVYGSSAGGFSALALAACIEGSTAVAINAQTDVLLFDNPRQVALVRKNCFGNIPEDVIRRDFGSRINMADRWRNVSKSRVFIIQNELDIHHFDVHFKPFWSSLGGEPRDGISSHGVHTAWIYRDERGHAPETIEMAQTIVSMLQL